MLTTLNNLALLDFGEAAPGELAQEYSDLKRCMQQKHLLDQQLAYYVGKILLNFCLLGVGMAALWLWGNSWFELFNAVFLGFVFTQMGFIVHDSGHQQIFHSPWKNDLLGILHADLLLGFSYTRWVVPHNMHHAKPNQLGRDPDLNLAVFAFTEARAREKRGLLRVIARYQAYFFFPLLTLEAVNLKGNHVKFLLGNKTKYRAVELICLACHFLLYFGLLFRNLSPWHAVLFIVVHQATFGLYLGLVITPNHFGMPVLSADSQLDFVSQQVLTARSIRQHWLADYCYGPLRCQIEHHLFPRMPLNKLREAQKIVRPYCEARGIAYHETGVLQSYWEILRFLHQVSAPLRQVDPEA